MKKFKSLFWCSKEGDIIYKVTLINNNTETVINAVSIEQEAPRLKTGTIKQGINTINSFSFSIKPDNPGYALIKPKTTLVNVYNVKTKKYEFEGRVLLPGQNYGTEPLIKNITCESELGYLQDSTQVYGEYHDITPKQFLEIIIANHNVMVEPEKQFAVGEVTVTDPNNSLYRYLGYDKTFDTIKDKLLDRLGGELQIRKENGIRYLDYLVSTGSKKSTIIRISKNMRTLEQEKDPTSVITRLVPLGNKLDNTDERLTIKSVNNNIPYIDDLAAQGEFGINQDTFTWDDVTDANNLKTKGIAKLQEINKIKKKHKIEALDLSTIGLDPDSLEVGNTYRVVNPLLDIDEDLRIVEKTIDIFVPQAPQLIIGDKFESIAQYQVGLNKSKKTIAGLQESLNQANNRIGTLSDDLANTTEELNQAKEDLSTTNETLSTNSENLAATNSELIKARKYIWMGI